MKNAIPSKPRKESLIKLRVPTLTKQAFEACCKADGKTMSKALLAFIEGEVQKKTDTSS